MKTYQILNCNDSSICISADILAMGFEPDSTYCIYFLDHTKDTDEANVFEIILLPFDWTTLQQLYSITIPLLNVPHATGHASRVLASAGIDMKTIVAVDSIAGNIGSLEATIVSEIDLNHIDDIFAKEYNAKQSQLRSFVPPPSQAKGTFLPDRRYLGRFISGRKYMNEFTEFTNKLADCTPPVLGSLVGLKRSGDTLDLAIPSGIIAYLNKKYGRPPETTLAYYDAALTVDTEFNCLSFSFLNPNEIRMVISFITEDRIGLFNIITDYLGEQQINFRIVYNKNIVPGKRMKMEFTADIRRTEFPLYTTRTIKLLIWSQLRERLATSEIAERSVIDRVELHAVSGYPRRLPRFLPDDRFDLIDMYFVSRGHCETCVPDKGRLSRHFDKSRNEQAERYVCLIGNALDGLHSQNKESIDHDARVMEQIREAFSAESPTDEDELSLRIVQDNGHKGLILEYGRRSYWLQLHESGQLCLVFDNTPPYNLRDRFFVDLARRCPEKKVSGKIFGELCSALLESLSYDFPSLASFEQFGTLDAARFRDTAKERFSRLSEKYISEKWSVDRFPIEGNEELSSSLERFLRTKYANEHESDRNKKLRIIDLGAAGGALTTLFAVRALRRLGMLDRVRLTLVDLSDEVLKATCRGDFELPTELEEDYLSPVTAKDYKKLLVSAETIVADLTELPKDIGEFDVVLSGFTHHHMNDAGRRKASFEMSRIVVPGGFVGLVDESLTYDQYLDWRTNHVRDSVRPAQESFLQTVEEHAKYFSDAGIKINKTNQAEQYYLICGVGKGIYKTMEEVDADTSGNTIGEDMQSDSKIDWLGAVIMAAGGLPGAQFVLGPLQWLRDQKISDEQNEELHLAIRESTERTDEVLRTLVKMDHNELELKALLSLLTPLFRQASSSSLGGGVARRNPATPLKLKYPVTKFFIPLERQLLFAELHGLFPTRKSMKELRVCALSAGLDVPEGDEADEVIELLINSLVGKDAKKLADLFTCLHRHREASKILQFAAEYLSDIAEKAA